MATIQLHTPHHMQDTETKTEYEANDIIHIVSVIGNDEASGTHFYVRGVPKRQHCLESANEVKQLVVAHKDMPRPPVSVNELHLHGNVGATSCKQRGTEIVSTWMHRRAFGRSCGKN